MPDRRHGSVVRSSGIPKGEHRMPGIQTARVVWLACAALLALALSAMSAGATSRVKDLANIEGVRQNPLIRYRLLVRLHGPRGTPNHIPFTQPTLHAMLAPMGVNIPA